MLPRRIKPSPLRILLLFALCLAVTFGPRPVLAEDPPEVAAPLEELVWVEIVPTDAQPQFKTWAHPSPENVVTACSLRLSAAQWSQDIRGFAHSAAHFDNCAIRQGADFVQERLEEASKAVNRKDFGEAMFAIGQALHAVQDFYSHTNYVEKMAEGPARTFAQVPIVPLWTGSGRSRLEALLAQGLASGVVGYSDLKACPPDAPDHSQVAKDTPGFNALAAEVVPAWANRSHYAAALDLAEQATQELLVWSFERWPSLSENCGRFLGYVAPGDRRRPESPR